MALQPIANEEGDVVTNEEGEVDPNGEYSFQSLGDPALDRLLLRCLNIEAEVRGARADINRIDRTIRWALLGATAFGVILLLSLWI